MLSSSHLSPHTVNHLLEVLSDEITAALARGDTFTIPGIGTISCRELRERTTSNLREGNKSTTQGSLAIPARRKITFRADLALVRKANAKNTEGMLPIVR